MFRGLDTSFSWRGVAASVAGAVAGGSVNNALRIAASPGVWAGIARGVVGGAAYGYFNQQWARGGKIDFVQLAMDAFGNAIGNDIVDKLTPKAVALDARALKALQSQASMAESERAQVQAKLDAQGGAVYERHDGAWYDEDGKAIDGVNGAFDRETGRILISGSLLDAAGSDPMAAATLQRVLYEEEGHRVASMLEDIRGIRDFAGDEGALIARTLMLEDIGQATSGRFDQQVSLTIGGQNLSFRTDAGHLAVASLELFDANYLASDRQSGRYEFSTAGKVAGKLAAFYEMGEIDALNSAKADLQGYIQRTGGDSVGAQALSMAVDLLFPTNVGDLIPVGKLAGFGAKVLGAVGDGVRKGTKTDRLKGHILNGELDAARREAAGEVVKRKADGTPWNHVQELRDAQRGLLNRIDSINRKLDKGGISDTQRISLQRELSDASKLLDKTEGYLPR